MEEYLSDILSATSELCGLPIVLHDYMLDIELPLKHREHLSGVCLEQKNRDSNAGCAKFCGWGGEIDKIIHDYPQGYIHRCRFGYWKIAIPVYSESLLRGVLFAGPCKIDNGSDNGQIATVANREWLESCRMVLVAVANDIQIKTAPVGQSKKAMRKRLVLDYLNHGFDRVARLQELSKILNLSLSRTRNIVVELFGKTFCELNMEVRMARAARYLEYTDIPLSQIARSLGFCDQSHFCKSFGKYFQVSPHQYRISRRSKSAPELE